MKIFDALNKSTVKIAILVMILTTICLQTVQAYPGGISGRTLPASSGCGSCHGSSSSTSVTVTASSQTGFFTVLPNTTSTFTVTVANSSLVSAGVGISVKDASGTSNQGTLTAGTGLTLSSGELMQSSAKAMQGGQASFTFTWTSPSAPGTYKLYAVGLAADGDGGRNGDLWNFMTPVDITVASPVISLNYSSFNFGDVKQSQYKDTILQIRNTGNTYLAVAGMTITGTNASEFSFQGLTTPFTVNQAESKNVTVRFTPTSFGMGKTAQINITSNAQTNPTVQLSGNGTAAPAPLFSTVMTKINFSGVKLNQYKDTSIVITNKGDADLILNNISFSGNNASEFSYSGQTLPLIINPGENIILIITFTPSSVGTGKTAAIGFTYNNSLTYSIDLSGDGLAPAQGAITVDIPAYDYVTCRVGSYVDKIFKVTNNGESTLLVNGTNFTGDNGKEFYLPEATGSFSLNPKQSFNLKIRFKPQTSGNKNAVVSFDNNVQSNTTITLSGYASNPPKPVLSLSDTLVNFGDILIDSTIQKTIKILNSGDTTLEVSSVAFLGMESGDFKIVSGGGKFTLASQAQRNLVISFTPKSDYSYKIITIVFNSTSEYNPNLKLIGGGFSPSKPKVTFTPGYINFAEVKIGLTNTQPVWITNVSKQKSIVKDVILVDPTGSFVFDKSSFPTELPSQSTNSYNITFKPVAEGSISGYLVIQTQLNSYTSSDSLELRGFGLKSDGADDNILPDNSFTVYPNPASSDILFAFDGDIQNCTELVIYDAFGFEITKMNMADKTLNWNLKNGAGIDVPAGFYYASALINGKSHIVKFIIFR
jgi:hypothetical protein